MSAFDCRVLSRTAGRACRHEQTSRRGGGHDISNLLNFSKPLHLCRHRSLLQSHLVPSSPHFLTKFLFFPFVSLSGAPLLRAVIDRLAIAGDAITI